MNLSEEKLSYYRQDYQVEFDWLRERIKELEIQLKEAAKCKDCEEIKARTWSEVWN
jgi:ribosomal protein L37AE/L43A